MLTKIIWSTIGLCVFLSLLYFCNLQMNLKMGQSYLRSNQIEKLSEFADLNKSAIPNLLVDAYQTGNKTAFDVLSKAAVSVDGISCGQLSLVHAAAIDSDPYWLETLLNAGANPDFNEVRNKISPLDEAIVANVPENVRLLIESGADINRSKPKQHSPITMAWTMRHGEISLLLLKAGADFNAQSSQYDSFVWKYKMLSYDNYALNNREEIDEKFLAEAKEWFRLQGFELENAYWEEAQGDVGVWTIPTTQ